MDNYAHAADIVRTHDRDRYLADLFAPEPARRHLFALHAFNTEVARIREAVKEPMAGEIRLQWWRDALLGDGGHPVATALVETIKAYGLPLTAFDNLLQARVFDLYDDPMPSLNDLEGYAGDTSSSLIQLAAIVLAGGGDPGTADAAGHAGVAYALTGLLRALPIHSARKQSFLPADLVAHHGVLMSDVFAGKATPELGSLLAELRAVARRHLAETRAHIGDIRPELLPAFLPVALVEPMLDRMERRDYDPFRSATEISPWRRQWILWRTASRRRLL